MKESCMYMIKNTTNQNETFGDVLMRIHCVKDHNQLTWTPPVGRRRRGRRWRSWREGGGARRVGEGAANHPTNQPPRPVSQYTNQPSLEAELIIIKIILADRGWMDSGARKGGRRRVVGGVSAPVLSPHFAWIRFQHMDLRSGSGSIIQGTKSALIWYKKKNHD